jgi:DNA-binding MarR family transcriptional regulator
MGSASPLKLVLQEWVAVTMRGSMRQMVRHAKASGLSMPQLGTLLHIQRKGVMAVSDIGSHLGVTNAATSQMLDRLVAQGLVARSEDPHDRRVRQIVLTPEGSRRVKEGLQVRLSWLDGLSDLLSPREQEQIVSALKLLIEKANLLDAESGPACSR